MAIVRNSFNELCYEWGGQLKFCLSRQALDGRKGSFDLFRHWIRMQPLKQPGCKPAHCLEAFHLTFFFLYEKFEAVFKLWN